MRYLTFQPQFVARIREGSKRHTIRKTCRLEPGRLFSLRIWTGLPYRSPQREIGIANVKLTMAVSIDAKLGIIGPHGPLDRGLIAAGDGFNGWAEMKEWFNHVHGLPFTGWIIAWEKFQPLYQAIYAIPADLSIKLPMKPEEKK